MLNQGFIFTRPQEQKLFLDGFRVANVSLTLIRPSSSSQCACPNA
jgi:hypothetical protein